VEVEAVDAELRVSVVYSKRSGGGPRRDVFTAAGPA
jgi:hypothetical protein